MTTHAERGEEVLAEAPVGDRGVYVYGVIREPGELPGDLGAVGDEDAAVRLVSHEGLAALVSDIHLTRPLGTPDDLFAHERVLDTVAEHTTVLPMRFGGVVAGEDAVTGELLAPNREFFESTLDELEGTVQFVLRGRYVDSAHLREIVTEEPEVGALRERLRNLPEDAGYDERLRLGEVVSAAVAAKRQADAAHLADAVSSAVVATAPHEVVGEEEALDVACLVERERQDQFEHVVDELAEHWRGRIQLRQVGPLAPYDFVPEG
ncbi:gas vesicle protein [Saccharopolyspora subtropica]|uniref:Gas vesicle protein n=1 Tax=Saccharopolyspora thermophila TaxID=89367 RepID=A0A917JXC6_9PSEU|nr:GvpL/GvpF family gas vesicle protein [Saccharopolyspora subtropica]GGI87420.1 gas vesicle protein [Saccharopolyspora subtropica]